MKDKTRQIREMNFSSIERKKVFEAKQRIAVEKFGNMFEDDTFFALELELNVDLRKDLDKEYAVRYNLNRKMN